MHFTIARTNWKRRKFITTVATAVGGVALSGLPGQSLAHGLLQREYTVNQIIDTILKEVPGAPFPKTVDTLKSGSGDQKVSGIVTTMFATDAVIKKAAEAGANFIIAHEPTFYGHTDETDWLQEHEVYQYKKALLDKYGIAIWRFHDYWHAVKPDGILMGVLMALGWEQYYNAEHPTLINLPSTALKDVVALVKKKLDISQVRVIGDGGQPCSRVALLPGAWGGRMQMTTLQQQKPDLLIVGELSEWETAEYIRDARYMGLKTGLIVLGHAASEEPGMQYLVQWLQPKVPGMKIAHISSGNPFMWM